MFAKLLVNGMSCEHCKKNIEEGLMRLKGINKVDAMYLQGFVEIDFEEAVISIEKIAAEIEDLGYEVKINR